jgi:lysophospholipid acyltransferase (LPLAT)-like uncharacterized protein
MTEETKSGAASEASAPKSHFDTSLRQFPFWRRIQIPIFAGAAVGLVRSVGPTLRIETLGLDHVKPFFLGGQPCIFSFWHRGLFPILWFARGRPIAVLTSANFDGQWAGRITKAMGLSLAVGSSTRGGLGGLAELETCLQAGQHAGFAVDGPHGPRYVAKRGPVFLAQRSGCPIICMHAYSQSALTLKKSWDKLQISYPFSRVALGFSPPIVVPRDADPELLNRKYFEMQRRLELIRDKAEAFFTRSAAEQDEDRAFFNSAWTSSASD